MSSNLQTFREKVERTPELQEKLTTLHSLPPEELISALVALSAEAGTPISAEDWSALQSGAISDEALGQVAGGIDFWRIFVPKLPPSQVQGQNVGWL